MKNLEIFSFDENKFDVYATKLVSESTLDENSFNVTMDLEMMFNNNCFHNYSIDLLDDDQKT